MLLELNAESIRSSMGLWRESVDLKIPMADEFKTHFMARRAPILDNFVRTSGAWLMLLRDCKPSSESQLEYDNLVADVSSFHEWAKVQLQELQNMADQAKVMQQVDKFLHPPKGKPPTP